MDGFGDRIAAEAQAALGQPVTERQCFDARPSPAVGGRTMDGGCTYSRVADRAGRTDRDALCRGGRRIEWRGTRSAGAYDYRITVRDSDAATGAARSVTTYEIGRHLGACPAD